MSNNRAEVIAAASLAKLMAGELHQVDQMSIEGNPSRRANQIDMNRFVAPLIGNQNIPQPRNFTYVDESLVQSMVPDSSIGSRPAPPDLIPMPAGYESKPQLPQSVLQVPSEQPLGPTRQLPPQPANPIALGVGMDDVTKGNIASIANNLVLLRKDFAKVLGPLLSFLKQQEPVMLNETKRVDISSLTPLVGMIDSFTRETVPDGKGGSVVVDSYKEPQQVSKKKGK